MGGQAYLKVCQPCLPCGLTHACHAVRLYIYCTVNVVVDQMLNPLFHYY